MGSASKIMYTIGKVFNIIEIVFEALFIILGILMVVMAKDFAAEASIQKTEAEIKAAGTGLIIALAIALVISVVVLILANRAKRAINNGVKENAPHIIMIVIGVFGDIFYLLGGVFGVIAENTENNGSGNA